MAQVALPDLILKSLINNFVVFDEKTADLVTWIYMDIYNRSIDEFDSIRDEVEEMLTNIDQDGFIEEYLRYSLISKYE